MLNAAGRIPRVCSQVDAEAALHDRDRAAQDRVRGARIPEEHRCHFVRDGAAVQEGAAADEEGAGRPGQRSRSHRKVEDRERHRRHADDRRGTGGFPASDRRNAGKRFSVSNSQDRLRRSLT